MRDRAREREVELERERRRERGGRKREADRLVDSGGFVENPQQLSICIMKSQPQSQLVPLTGLQLPQGKRPLPPSSSPSPSSSSLSSLQKVEPEKLKNNRHVLLLLQFSLICNETQTCNVLHNVPQPDWHTATLIDGKREETDWGGRPAQAMQKSLAVGRQFAGNFRTFGQLPLSHLHNTLPTRNPSSRHPFPLLTLPLPSSMAITSV